MDTLLRYGLFAVFVALVLTSVGLPIPEDISLAVAGVLARTGHATLGQAILVGYVGVLTGDLIAFALGRRVGLHPKGWLGRLFGERQIERILKYYRRFGDYTIVVARNIPGMRFPAFFFSGATGVPLARFLLLDGLAAIVTTGVWVGAGWYLGDRIEEFTTLFGSVRWGLTIAGFVVLSYAAWRLLSRRKELPKLQ
ncbi:MAG: DedA family protein [Proteobacteria bacterium]|nr:DedA family protein [Pseudomonadota bacterium]